MPRRLAWLVVTVVLVTAPAGATEWWIPASAHAEGAEGSVWRTDLVGRNFGTTDQTVTVTLLPRGQDNSALSSTATVAIPAGATVQVSDAIMELFGFEGAAALRLAAPDDQLVLTSRTYTQSATGTFGQSIPAVSTGAALASGEAALLMGLDGTQGRRTNLGWVSLEPGASTVTVELLDSAGSLLASESFDEYPFGHTQLNDVFSALDLAPHGNAYARVSSSGRWVPYASVVAGGSNDPVYVPARSSLEWSTDLLFPAVIHAPGANDTSWRSDLWVLNSGSNPATVVFELWRQGQANPNPATAQVEVASGEQAEIVDVVFEVFGLDDAQGALALHADQLLIATSRTYNTAAAGTYGQFIAGQPLAALGGVGETLYLPGAVQTDSFRSNVGLVTTGAGSTVELVLRGSDGTVLATASRDLGVNQQLQSSLSGLFGASDVSAATVEVTLASADETGAVVAAYLSVIDNETGDPTYSPAAHGLGSEPDLGSVASTVVSVTGSLTGAVEQSGPTGVAPSAPGGGKDLPDCMTVERTGDTIPPGSSPLGKCWQVSVVWDDCVLELPAWGLTWTRDGSAAADVCVIDDYPSSLVMDVTTTLDNSNTGEFYSLTQVADLALAFTFVGSQVSTAHLEGNIAVTLNEDTVTAWGDLTWSSGVGGLSQFPVGVMVLTFPYDYGGHTYPVQVTVSYDGTEWAFVQVRAGFWQTSFYLNLTTGETMPA